MSDDSRPGDNPTGPSFVPGDGDTPTGGGGSPQGDAGGHDYPTEPIPQQSGNPPQGQGHGGQGHYPPEGQPGQYPPQGQPGSYPQGPPGQYGQPQPGQYSQGQYPLQGQPGQYPQGQPKPYGYGQQGQYSQGQPGYGQQQGWDQQYQQQDWEGGQGLPPKKSNTGMIVAIIAVLIALILGAVALFVMMGRSPEVIPPTTPTEQATQPAEPSDRVDPSTEPAEPVEPVPEPTDPGDPITRPTEPAEPNGETPPEGLPPVMPSEVGEFTAFMEPEPDSGAWTGPDGANNNATWIELLGKEDLIDQMEDPEDIGDWSCSRVMGSEMSQCVADAYGGTVLLVGSGTTAETAAFGDELLAAWK